MFNVVPDLFHPQCVVLVSASVSRLGIECCVVLLKVVYLTYWTLSDGMAATMLSKERHLNNFITMCFARRCGRTHAANTHVSIHVRTYVRMHACLYMHAYMGVSEN